MSASQLHCPVPLPYDHITMAHGGGGRLMQQLLSTIIQSEFTNPLLNQHHDSTVFAVNTGKLAFTTDSYVINPIFFPGGDIGQLAVCGTLNDLAMSGAKPLYLSCSFILEEGFPITDLKRIVASMQTTAARAGAAIITGDTKVVDKGKGDGIFINTAGIGVITHNQTINPKQIQPGDNIILSNDIARHGIAIMLEREGIRFNHKIVSDCNDLSGLINNLLEKALDIHCLRDLTRGGLASGLIELAATSACEFEILEKNIPIQDDVQSACDILGLDPMYIANEGCCVLFIPEAQTAQMLKLLQANPLSHHARHIGSVTAKHDRGRVSIKTHLGSHRVLELLSGEQLPRIC